jgi:hypothetical protein
VPVRKAYSDYDAGEESDPDTGPLYADLRPLADETPQERYGGLSVRGAFFGWLVAIAMTVLLAGIVGAGATVVGRSLNITRGQVEQRAEIFGLAGAIAVLAILMIAFFTGGYVAGRVSRFDGGRQGRGVWLLGLFVTILVAALGARLGIQYEVFPQADLPSVPIRTDTLSVGGVFTLIAVILGTRMSAVSGGKAGQRYHLAVDRAVISAAMRHESSTRRPSPSDLRPPPEGAAATASDLSGDRSRLPP